MFETWWRYQQAQIAQRGQSMEKEIHKLDEKIEQLMDRLVEADSQTMVKAYEKRVKQLETDKAVLVEKSGQSMRPMRSFDAALRTALEFISNPHKLWDSGRLCDRRAVLKLAFPGGFKYHRNTGLRTAETPLPFKVLGELMSKKIQMAGKCMYQVRHAFSELERNLIRERTKAGMEAARQRGAHLGRPKKLSRCQIIRMQGLLQGQPNITPVQIADQFGVSSRTIYRALSQYALSREELAINAR